MSERGENSDKQPEKTKVKDRDSKGRFIKGKYKGGPGGSRKKTMEERLHDTTMRGLRSKNLQDQLKAANLALKLISMKSAKTDEQQLDPIILDLLDKCSDLDLSDFTLVEDDDDDDE